MAKQTTDDQIGTTSLPASVSRLKAFEYTLPGAAESSLIEAETIEDAVRAINGEGRKHAYSCDQLKMRQV